MHVIGPSKMPNEGHGCHNEEYDPQKQWIRGWPLVITCGAPNDMWGHTSVLMGFQNKSKIHVDHLQGLG